MIKFLVLLDENPVVVGGEYCWLESDARLIMNNLIQKIEDKLMKTNDPIKSTIYQMQLDSIEMKELVVH